jgi:small conductance mechanosensitive channel
MSTGVPAAVQGRRLRLGRRGDRHGRSNRTVPDNVRTVIANNKAFNDTIQNFSANPYRRVDLLTTVSNNVDHREAIRLLRERLQRVPNVLESPAPDVDVLQFTAHGPQLCVRPYCSNRHYWQVYFDTTRVIREALGEAGFPGALSAPR